MARLTEASREFFEGLKHTPGLEDITNNAGEFIRITGGKSTPWSEALSPEAREIVARYNGTDHDTFSTIVQIMRPFFRDEDNPERTIPDSFLRW